MRELEKRITDKAFLLGFLLALIPFTFGYEEMMFGIWAGSLISILIFKLLARHVEGRLSSAKARMRRFFINFPLKYGIITVILWLAISKDFGFLVGTALGLFVMRLAFYTEHFLVRQGVKRPVLKGRKDR